MTKKSEMVLDRLLDRLDTKERTIGRITRRLGPCAFLAEWRGGQARDERA